jgi:hypothetical protein
MQENSKFSFDTIFSAICDDNFNPQHTYLYLDFNNGQAFRLNPADSSRDMKLTSMLIDSDMVQPYNFG